MSDIAPIGQTPSADYARGVRPQPPQGATPTSRSAAPDKVEFSSRAQIISRLKGLNPIREELVQRVRGEIASGRYETEDKIDAAIDNLAQDL